MTSTDSPNPGDRRHEPAEGANKHKVDVSQPKKGEQTPEERASMNSQEKRADDARPAGLSASEMVRFRELENKSNLTDEERTELQSLGQKKQYGLPANQYEEVKQQANNPNPHPASLDIDNSKPEDKREDQPRK